MRWNQSKGRGGSFFAACFLSHSPLSRGGQLKPHPWASPSPSSGGPGRLWGTQQARPETLSVSIWGPLSAPVSSPGWGPCVLALLVEVVLRRTFGYLTPCFLGVRWQSAPRCHEWTFRTAGQQTLVWLGGLSDGVCGGVASALGPSVCRAPGVAGRRCRTVQVGGHVTWFSYLSGFLLITFYFVH